MSNLTNYLTIIADAITLLEEQQALEAEKRLAKAALELRSFEVAVRRAKMDEIIIAISRLDLLLKRTLAKKSLLKIRYPAATSKALDHYLAELNNARTILMARKRSLSIRQGKCHPQ